MKDVFRATIQLLTFRITREEFLNFERRHLLFGLVCTWLVGMGRYWDNPRVSILQHLGIGSVIYIFVLSLLLWLVPLPLKPKNWSYRHVLTFVSLVSPPALLYALPVEKFFSMDSANAINVLFLLIVSVWRVSLLVFYLKRHAQLRGDAISISVFLPITFIISGLTFLNLERAVFNIMAGVNSVGTSNDDAYMVLTLLSLFSMLLFLPLVLAYVFLAVKASGGGKKTTRTK